MRIGVVGYGTGVRHFHTPFIEAAEGIERAGVVTRSPQRREQVAADVHVVADKPFVPPQT